MFVSSTADLEGIVYTKYKIRAAYPDGYLDVPSTDITPADSTKWKTFTDIQKTLVEQDQSIMSPDLCIIYPA
jgi:hypothetical protein